MRVNKKERLLDIYNKCTIKGGMCLDTEYYNSKQLMNFICANNHSFSTTAGRIMRGHWCLECSGSKKHTIESINELVIDKNIKCISSIYLGNKYKLDWKCLICGFIWQNSKNGIDKDFKKCKNCFEINQIIKAKIAAKQI